jgi:hypothetical protein
MKTGMILGMYRILGCAAFLIALTSSMQDPYDYENYDPLKSINLYSFALPIFAYLYDK